MALRGSGGHAVGVGGSATEGAPLPRTSHHSPEVSVVVPTRDRGALLGAALRSVLAQRDVDLEVVVVDDGSGDPPVLPSDPRVVSVRNEEPQGVAAARNQGLAAARGRWIAFVDDDDVWSDRKISEQLRAVERSAGARWCCAGAVVVDMELRVLRPQWPPPPGDASLPLLQSNVIPGGASGVLAERQLLEDVGGFDESLALHADWDLWIRLALRSPLASAHAPLVGYRTHGGAMSAAIPRAREEVEALRAKYAPEREARAVTISDAARERYYAEVHQRRGRRVAAATSHVKLALRHGVRSALAWAPLALVWPGSIRLRDRRYRRAASGAWAAEAEEWLAPLRKTAEIETTRRAGAPSPEVCAQTEAG